MSKREKNGLAAIGGAIVTLVTLLVALKLIGVLSWSWWLIFSPLWFPPAFVVGLVLMVLFAGIAIVAFVCLVLGIAVAITFWKSL